MSGIRARTVLGPLVCLSGLAGCGPAKGPLPLGPQPIAYVDTLPIAEPRSFEPVEKTGALDAPFAGSVAGALSVRHWAGPQRRALNLNDFDEVVSSAWFEHRNGARRLTPEEVARGPTTAGPDTSLLTIVAGKSTGRTPGFTVEDRRGDRYLFKFDPPGFLHMASSAEVISSRLFHAAGYYTPENYIVVFDTAQLALAPEARVDSAGGGERPMTREHVEEILSRVDALPDGRYLAMASKFVPGVPKGPFRFKGRRSDDPNEHYQHEHRRELRGLRILAAWLNDVDVGYMNTLDAYVEPGYLRHYLIDFGGSLGSGTLRPREPREGREHDFEPGPTLARLFTLGFYQPPWETHLHSVIDPSIGWLRVAEFDPAGWRANQPNEAFSRVTPADGYWGAKLVGAFTDEQIRATVAKGRLPGAFAADTLAKIIAFRRDRTVAYWYSRVTPVENVEARGGAAAISGLIIAFDDLGIRDGVWDGAGTSYRWEFRHEALDRRWSGEESARAGSVPQSLTLTPESGSDLAGDAGRELSGQEALATLTVTAIRGESAGRAALVYLLWEGEGEGYRVVGLEH